MIRPPVNSNTVVRITYKKHPQIGDEIVKLISDKIPQIMDASELESLLSSESKTADHINMAPEKERNRDGMVNELFSDFPNNRSRPIRYRNRTSTLFTASRVGSNASLNAPEIMRKESGSQMINKSGLNQEQGKESSDDLMLETAPQKTDAWEKGIDVDKLQAELEKENDVFAKEKEGSWTSETNGNESNNKQGEVTQNPQGEPVRNKENVTGLTQDNKNENTDAVFRIVLNKLVEGDGNRGSDNNSRITDINTSNLSNDFKNQEEEGEQSKISETGNSSKVAERMNPGSSFEASTTSTYGEEKSPQRSVPNTKSVNNEGITSNKSVHDLDGNAGKKHNETDVHADAIQGGFATTAPVGLGVESPPGTQAAVGLGVGHGESYGPGNVDGAAGGAWGAPQEVHRVFPQRVVTSTNPEGVGIESPPGVQMGVGTGVSHGGQNEPPGHGNVMPTLAGHSSRLPQNNLATTTPSGVGVESPPGTQMAVGTGIPQIEGDRGEAEPNGEPITISKCMAESNSA